MESRSEYNNNPGNLRPGKNVTYEGQIGVDDKGFAIFDTPAAGERASKNNLKIQIGKGFNTPEKFVDRYAPPGKDEYGDENSEESRENYKIWIAQKLGLKSTSDPFPEDAVDKLHNAVRAFESGTWNKPEPEKTEETVTPDQGERLAPEASPPGKKEEDMPFIGGTGAAVGLGTATAVETAKKLSPLLPNILNTVTGQNINPSQPVSRMSLQRYLNSQIAPNLRLPLSELEKVSGAGKIRTMSEVQNALRAIQAVEEQKTAKPLYKMEPGRPGVFVDTGKVTTSVKPGRPGVDLSAYEAKARGPVAQAVARQATTAGEVARAVAPSALRIGAAGLGGATAATQGYEAVEMAKKIAKMRLEGKEPSAEDIARLMAKSASSAGGALGMLPFGITQAGGLALQVPDVGFSIYDWLQERKKHTEPRGGLEYVDPMGNTLGVAP